jgi:D-tyrosyl-tRNA(Tyr) deacylase
MRAVVQRVKEARVEVNEKRVSAIETGLLVYLGVHGTDELADVEYLRDKIVGLRVFEDAAGKMNLSIQEAGGSLLLVSQFTLYGDVRRGRRPSFDRAAAPEQARALYEYFAEVVRARGVRAETGVFQANMQVELVNEGPVTILIDSEKVN